MKLYKEVLIESAEQAEALPVGTVAHDRDHDTDPDLIPYVKITPWLWVSVWDVDDDHELNVYGVCPNSHIVGDYVLVPIEVKEVNVVAQGVLEYDMNGRVVLEQANQPSARDYKRTEFHTAWRPA